MQRNDQKSDVFNSVKRLVKTNQDVSDQQCMRNDDGVLTFSHKDQKIVWKSYHEKRLSTFPCIGIVCLGEIQLAVYVT